MRPILIIIAISSLLFSQPTITTEWLVDGSFDARSVYATDMDGDGDVDIVGAANDGDDISWWENDGTPNNADWTEYLVDGDFDGAWSVYATDMDGDGDVDILGAAYSGDDISWWENDGTPNNADWTEYLVDGDFDGALSIYATDMDGDGDVDIVGAAWIGNDISWWENDGNPKQNSWTEYLIDGSFNGANSVYATDMDGDGDVDVLGAAYGSDDISWWENDGTPNNASWTEYIVDGDFDIAYSVYATDMDGDGDVDILGAARNDNDISWWENDGNPKQNSWTEYLVDGDFDGAVSVYATDMDGDGDVDILGAAYDDNDISWWENDGTPNNANWTEHAVDGSFGGAFSVYATDMDGDGDVDVLGGSRSGDDISWWENNSITPSLPSFTERTIEGDFRGAFSVYAVDMDGDGDMDVVGAAYTDSDIAWFENNGSQSFTEHTIEGDFDGARSVYAVDMDGDGDMDVVGAAITDDDIAWFENNGSQSFTERTIKGDFNGAISVYAVDMDGDGDMDVVGAARYDDDIAWFENNGSQSFTEHTIEGDFDGASGVYAVDMDGDGDMDVVGAANTDNDIAWFENNGSQSFTEHTIEGDFDGARSVYAVDMDGDGDMDVVAAAYTDDDIAWFENNGSQSFTERTIKGDFDGARSVYAVDMDGDGDMDVVAAAFYDDDIAWFENNGSQSFTERTIEGSFDAAYSVYAVDMDGDGDMDVVGAAQYDNDIAWFENIGLEVSGNAGFRMLSSPVAGTIYDELLAPFWTQGMTGANTTSGTANVWTYNAATSAWAALTNLTTNSYTAGAGILIYVYTDVDFDGDDDIAGGVNVGIVNGTENSATVSISTTASAWNLLGNPFVSTIDADQLFSDNSNYTAVVYVYDDANSQYNTWNGSTGDLSNGLISPYQGFWIQSGGSGTSFSFTASSKSTSVGTFYRTMSDSSGSVAFQLSSGSYNTTAYLSFNIDALAGIDNADAYKLLPFGADDHLTSMFYVGEVALNTSNLPFNITNPMTADMDVMLLTAANDSFYTNTGDVSMSWDIGSMPDDMTIHLLDQITLDTVDIRAVGSYTFALVEKGGFSATGGTSPALYPRIGQNRFKVLVNTTTVSVDEELLPIQYALHQNYPNPFNPITTLRYDIPENSHVTITIYDMLGRQVKTIINQTQDAGFKTIQWNATNDYGKPVSAGIYLCQIQAGEYISTKKMVLLK